MAALEKARFFDPDDASADAVYVQFNPNSLEYSYGRKRHKKDGNKDGEEGGQQSSLDVWEQASLSMRLFFNTYVSETSYTDVRDEIMPLRAFLCRTDEKGTAEGRSVVFAWGTLAYRGTMDSFSVTYQMFAADGTPVQAEASLSISGEDAEAVPDPSQDLGDGGGAGEDLSWLFEEEEG